MNNRIERVLNNMAAAGLTRMIVSDPKSIWYLTGVAVEPYERLFALLLRRDGKHVFFLNRLFNVKGTGLDEVWYSDTDDVIGMIAERIVAGSDQLSETGAGDQDRSGAGENAAGDKAGVLLGIDKEWPARFLLPLLERLPGVRPVLASDCVDRCRAVKDAEEIALMREASRINDEVITAAAGFVREGMTEREVADFIDAGFAAAGCSGPSFTTIVSFGANAADPHHEPDSTVLKSGDCVLFDMGCVKDRYCSDMTRTFICGEPEREFSYIYELVRRANEAAENLVRPGVRLCDVDAAARGIISEAGYGEYFNHRLGHFIGQTDHEKGDVSSANAEAAVPGMIFSIEPGIYIPGRYGVRIEDLVLVTKDGCEILNRVPKELRKVSE